MFEVASTPQYEIRVSSDRNRMYLKVIGYWSTPADVPNYRDDLRRAVRRLLPGFTLLTDATTMVPHDRSVMPLHEEAQRMLVAAGLDCTAEIIPKVVTRLHARRISDVSGMKKGSFETVEEGEAWLNSSNRAGSTEG